MQKLRSDSGTGFHMVRRLPVTTTVGEVLALLQLRLHQGAAGTGLAVTIDSEAEPRPSNTNLGGITPTSLDRRRKATPPWLP